MLPLNQLFKIAQELFIFIPVIVSRLIHNTKRIHDETTLKRIIQQKREKMVLIPLK